MYDGQRHVIYFLGSIYGQFQVDLRDRRQAQLIPNLLMLGTGTGKEFSGAYEYVDSDGQRSSDRAARIVLYDTSLVVLPEPADPFIVAYNFIEQLAFDPASYSLNISLDLGERLQLTAEITSTGRASREVGNDAGL